MKNMDPLNDNVVTLMQESSNEFLKAIWKDGQYFTIPTHFFHLLAHSLVTPLLRSWNRGSRGDGGWRHALVRWCQQDQEGHVQDGRSTVQRATYETHADAQQYQPKLCQVHHTQPREEGCIIVLYHCTSDYDDDDD